MSGRWRPVAAAAICLAAVIAVLLGGPEPLRQVVVAAFLVLVPGLLLVHVLRIADPLLGLVLALMTGPVVWTLLATLAVFAHVWHPEAFVVVAALGLGVAGVLLALRTPPPPSAARLALDRFDDSRDIEGLVEDRMDPRVGKSHRGAFPSPYEGY